MRVLDHEPAAWFLLADGDRLLLDCVVSYSAFSWSTTIALDDDETAGYAAEGRDHLTRLAQRVQDSAPGVRGSTSPYTERDVAAVDGARITAAVAAWRHCEPGGPAD